MFIDTNKDCTKEASHFVKRGVEAVGRYYATSNGSKVIKKSEAQALSSKGIKIFTIFEDFGAADKLNLTAKQGRKDGSTAKKQANAIGQPRGSVIYFAAEGLPHGYKEADLPAIRDYFAGVKEGLNDDYTAGVYGDGIVCKSAKRSSTKTLVRTHGSHKRHIHLKDRLIFMRASDGAWHR